MDGAISISKKCANSILYIQYTLYTSHTWAHLYLQKSIFSSLLLNLTKWTWSMLAIVAHLCKERAATFRYPCDSTFNGRVRFTAITCIQQSVRICTPAPVQPVVPGIQALGNHRDAPVCDWAMPYLGNNTLSIKQYKWSGKCTFTLTWGCENHLSETTVVPAAPPWVQNSGYPVTQSIHGYRREIQSGQDLFTPKKNKCSFNTFTYWKLYFMIAL